MSIQFFDIDIPVRVRSDAVVRRPYERHAEKVDEEHRMTVRVVMGSDATAKDAVEAFARKLEEACKTVDTGDET